MRDDDEGDLVYELASLIGKPAQEGQSLTGGEQVRWSAGRWRPGYDGGLMRDSRARQPGFTLLEMLSPSPSSR